MAAMRITEGISGIPEFWLSQKIGQQKGADASEIRQAGGFSRGISGPGQRKGYVLSESLRERLAAANRESATANSHSEKHSPVFSLTDPAQVDWANFRKRLEEQYQRKPLF